MKHKVVQLISVIIIAAFASQPACPAGRSLAWARPLGNIICSRGLNLGYKEAACLLSPGQGIALRPQAAGEREIFEGDIILNHETGTIRIVKYIEGGIPYCLRVSRAGEKSLEKDDPEKLRKAYKSGKISIFRGRSFTIDIEKQGTIKTFIIPADLAKRCCDLGLNIIKVIQDSVDLIETTNFAKIRSPKEIGFESGKFDTFARQHPNDLKEAMIISLVNLLNRTANSPSPALHRAIIAGVLRPRAFIEGGRQLVAAAPAPLLKFSFPKEENKTKARLKAVAFANDLNRRLQDMGWDLYSTLVEVENKSLICNKVTVPCYEAVVNIMTHAGGGDIEIDYNGAKPGHLKRLTIVTVDKGPGIDNPNELLQHSIDVHREARFHPNDNSFLHELVEQGGPSLTVKKGAKWTMEWWAGETDEGIRLARRTQARNNAIVSMTKGPEEHDDLSEMEDNRFRAEGVENRSDATSQNRHDILSFLRDIAENADNPDLVDREFEIDALYQRLKATPRYAYFRKEAFYRTIGDIFGRIGARLKETISITDLDDQTGILRDSAQFRVAKVIKANRRLIRPDCRNTVRLILLLDVMPDVTHESDAAVAGDLLQYLEVRSKKGALKMVEQVPRKAKGAKRFPVLKRIMDELDDEKGLNETLNSI